MSKNKSSIIFNILATLLIVCMFGILANFLFTSSAGAEESTAFEQTTTEDTEEGDVNYDEQIETYSANTDKYKYPLSLENAIMTDMSVEASFYIEYDDPYILVKTCFSDENLEYFEDIVMELNEGNFTLFVCESEQLYNAVSNYFSINTGVSGASMALKCFYPSEMESMGMYSFETRENLNKFRNGAFSFFVDITNLNFNKPIYIFGGFTYETIGTGEEQYVGTLCKTSLVSINPYNDLVSSIESPKFECENQYKSYAENVQKIMGIYHEEDSTITFKYLEKTEESRFSYKTVNVLNNVPSYMLQNKEKVFESVKNIMGFESLTEFNVVLQEYYKESISGKELSSLYGERIIRQVDDEIQYTYTYDSERNTGVVEVVYADFQYSHFPVRINNNDADNPLCLYLYTSRTTETEEMRTLIFNFEDLKTQIRNLCLWVSDIKSENVTVSGKETGVYVAVEDDNIYVTFPKNNQNLLASLCLDILAEIVEDVEWTFKYEYVEINENLDCKIITTAGEQMYLSKILQMSSESFKEEYGAKIKAAISPSSLNGQEYMTYVGIEKVKNAKDQTYLIRVKYSTKSVIKIRTDKKENYVFKVLDENSLDYKLSDIIGESFIPNGWRIDGIEVSDNALRIVGFSEQNPLETVLHVSWNTSEDKTVEVILNITDEWVLDIEYFEQYKDTPFLEKKTMHTSIKVLDYEDVNRLTEDDLKNIMNKKSFELMGLSTFDNIEVSSNGGGYKVKINYTHASLKKTDYNGNIDEVKVYITAYSDWTETFGKDWSILFLNTSEKTYFQYSNDVNYEDLYGFFSVAVFSEKVTDLNSYFAEYSADGCKTVYQSQEVTGSDFYKFFGKINTLSSKIVMGFAEIFNDENQTLHSYFFYLDGTTNKSFIATNGADDYDDEDTAISNWWDDATSWVKDVAPYAILVVSIIAGVGILFIAIKLCSKIQKSDMHVAFKIIFYVAIALALGAIVYFVGPQVVSFISSLGGL